MENGQTYILEYAEEDPYFLWTDGDFYERKVISAEVALNILWKED